MVYSTSCHFSYGRPRVDFIPLSLSPILILPLDHDSSPRLSPTSDRRHCPRGEDGNSYPGPSVCTLIISYRVAVLEFPRIVCLSELNKSIYNPYACICWSGHIYIFSHLSTRASVYFIPQTHTSEWGNTTVVNSHQLNLLQKQITPPDSDVICTHQCEH